MQKTVNGCSIHYEVWPNAQSAETPVLFLHGWGCDIRYFAGLMDAMRERAPLIALDFPAHGASDEPPAPWGVRDFAEQVRRLLDELAIDRVDIVAHSFGARVALYLGTLYPRLIGKLVITGGSGIRKPATAAAGKRAARYKRLNAAARFIGKLPYMKTPMKTLQNKLVQAYGSPDYARLSEGMRVTFNKIVTEDLTPLLPNIGAPTLLIWGSNDEETPLWMGETMEAGIPDAGLVVFEGRSHFAFLEENARFLTIVKQFFWGGNKG